MNALRAKVFTFFISHLYLTPDKLGLSNKNAFILMFHHVTNEKVNATPNCICNVQQFENILTYLTYNNIKAITIDEALENFKKRIRKGFAVITFDDGIDNTFNIAYPLLKRNNLPFTVYITLNYLDKKGYITSEQLKILNNEKLCTVGSHSLNHSVLRGASNAKEEIFKSRRMLENMLNTRVVHFAYPYGGPAAISFKNIFEAKNAGYLSAVSSLGTRLNFFSTLTRFYLPRLNGSVFDIKK